MGSISTASITREGGNKVNPRVENLKVISLVGNPLSE